MITIYKVLIVDDEDIIVRGLQNVLKWNNYNCEVVGTANDVDVAIKQIQELQPDIVFTDICMPKASGLNLVEHIRKVSSRTRITILSGYSEFDYAQRAIEFGVTRYLLKPSKMYEIEEAVRVMVSQLNEMDNTQPVQQNIETSKEPTNNFILNNAIKYMQEKYYEKLTLQEVAEKVYVSQWHLSKLISKNTEYNFTELLNNIRLDKAKKMLANPSLRISDISEDVGFSDVAHFSRIFKKYTGTSPIGYRNSLNEKNMTQND